MRWFHQLRTILLSFFEKTDKKGYNSHHITRTFVMLLTFSFLRLIFVCELQAQTLTSGEIIDISYELEENDKCDSVIILLNDNLDKLKKEAGNSRYSSYNYECALDLLIDCYGTLAITDSIVEQTYQDRLMFIYTQYGMSIQFQNCLNQLLSFQRDQKKLDESIEWHKARLDLERYDFDNEQDVMREFNAMFYYYVFNSYYFLCEENFPFDQLEVKMREIVSEDEGGSILWQPIIESRKESLRYKVLNESFDFEQNGEYDRAVAVLESGLKLFDPGTEMYFRAKDRLAECYKKQGQTDRCEAMLLQLKDEKKTHYGEFSLEYEIATHTLQRFYSENIKAENREELLIRMAEKMQAIYGKTDYHYGNALYDLADFYRFKEDVWDVPDYNRVIELLTEAKSLKDSYLKNYKESDYSNILQSLGHAKLRSGQFSETDNEFEESGKYWYTHVYERLFTASSEERTSQWGSLSYHVNYNYAISYDGKTKSECKLSYNDALMSKGLLLRSVKIIENAILSSNDTLLIANWKELRHLRNQIETIKQNESFDEDSVNRLTYKARRLDEEITRTATTYRDLKADMSMTWQEVQKQLKPGEASIEFVDFDLFIDSTMYAALVLRPEMEAPTWTLLCGKKQLQHLLQPGSNNPAVQTNFIYTQNGNKLYDTVWKPLEEILQGVQTVYYSPSGLLHKVAFNAIPVNSENTRLCDRYNLNLVSSTRQITQLKKETPTRLAQNMVNLYGGLYYSKDFKPSEEDSKTISTGPQLAKHEIVDHDSDNQDFHHRGENFEIPSYELRTGSGIAEWQYLRGTRIEAENIASELKSHKIPYNYYTTLFGDEASFKALSGTNTGVIFLATHGFFLPDVLLERNVDIARVLGRGNRSQAVENPMLRSGLAMAGINSAWSSKEPVTDGEDNILTAAEIAELDFSKTRLVALSACETGLGDVKNSEGVFGLQRAFKLAGVESLLMSLWKVPDEATMLLTSTFYKEWLSGKTKQQSLKIAQKVVREYKGRDYSAPFYWAAFVLMD